MRLTGGSVMPLGKSDGMAISTPPTDPDGLAIHYALSRPDLNPEDVYNATQGIANMAGRTTVEMLGAKIDAQSARVEASFAELEEELRRQHTLIWTLIAILGAAVGGGLVALIRQIT